MDRNFAMPCCVMIHSALAAMQRTDDVVVHLLVIDVDRAVVRNVVTRMKAKFKVQIHVVDVDSKAFANAATVRTNLPVATFLRLSLAEHIPDASRVIYIDGDCVCVSDILEIAAIQMNRPVAAVRSERFSTMHHRVGLREVSNALAVSPYATYFNAGVLLIDLEAWRDEDIYGKSLHMIEKHGDALSYADQDILNLLFAGRWYALEARWNYQVQPRLSFNPNTPWQELFANPGIVHFIGPSKPWIRDFRNPFRPLWHQQLRQCGYFNRTSQYAAWKARWLWRCGCAESKKILAKCSASKGMK